MPSDQLLNAASEIADRTRRSDRLLPAQPPAPGMSEVEAAIAGAGMTEKATTDQVLCSPTSNSCGSSVMTTRGLPRCAYRTEYAMRAVAARTTQGLPLTVRDPETLKLLAQVMAPGPRVFGSAEKSA